MVKLALVSFEHICAKACFVGFVPGGSKLQSAAQLRKRDRWDRMLIFFLTKKCYQKLGRYTEAYCTIYYLGGKFKKRKLA